MLVNSLKHILKNTLSSFGVELRRIQETEIVPTFFESSKEALLFSQGGKPSTFPCPIQLCTHHTGIGFSPSDWNPFIETLKQFEINPLLQYKDSTLSEFYNTWTPKSAAEAIAGYENLPKEFSIYPTHFLFLSPWSSLSYSEVDQDTHWWNRKDNEEHGCSHLRFPEDGWAFSGPVHIEKGMLEFNRIIKLYKSIKEHGYDQSKGLIGVTQLKRGNDLRYLVGGGGYHRAIALSALGCKSLPARFHRNSTVDTNDVNNWPQVKNNLWTEQQALGYVDFLFSSDRSIEERKASFY